MLRVRPPHKDLAELERVDSLAEHHSSAWEPSAAENTAGAETYFTAIRAGRTLSRQGRKSGDQPLCPALPVTCGT